MVPHFPAIGSRGVPPVHPTILMSDNCKPPIRPPKQPPSVLTMPNF